MVGASPFRLDVQVVEASPYAAQGFHPIKLETHLHTLHSDGRDSVAAMFEACAERGYQAVALTDHNTISGWPEAATAAERLGLICVPGVEVTTFRGHAVALAVDRVPEWRCLSDETGGIAALAAKVHAQGGVVCVSHPAALGSPVCSGCAWEWPSEPSTVDLWEVFSAPRPNVGVGLQLWRQMLRRGARIAPVAAGDVHSVAAARTHRAATYVLAQEPSLAGVLGALRGGRLFASRGPQLEFWLEKDRGEVALAGERVSGDGWAPRCSLEGARVQTEQVAAGVCLYAELRDAQGRLEAISAPIWIETEHSGETSV